MASKVLAVGNSQSAMLRFRGHLFNRLKTDYDFTIFVPTDSANRNCKKFTFINNYLSSKREISIIKIFKFFKAFHFEYKKKYDHLLIYGVQMSFLIGIYLLFLGKKKSNIVFIFTGLGAVFLRSRYAFIKFLLVRLIIPNVPNKIVVLNQDDEVFIGDLIDIGSQKLYLMDGESVDGQSLVTHKSDSTIIKRLVFVSRPVHDKGCLNFKKLVAALRSADILVPISVYGFDRISHGELKQDYFDKLESYGVKFEGYVSGLEKQITGEDLVLIISDREGANRVLLECLHFRIAFLASPVPGIKNFVPPSIKSRCLVDFSNAETAVESIKWFLNQNGSELEDLKNQYGRERLYFSVDEAETFYREKLFA